MYKLMDYVLEKMPDWVVGVVMMIAMPVVIMWVMFGGME